MLRWLAAVLLLLNGAYFWYADSTAVATSVAPAPVIGAQRLVLLSEVSGGREDVGSDQSPADDAQPDDKSGTASTDAIVERLQCWELGPLGNDLLADLAELFERVSLPIRSFRRQQVDATDYWVYLAVGESGQRGEFQRQLADLDVESYVIGGGELEGNISLGLFTSRERAEAVAAPLQQKKMPVVIHSRQRRQDQIWVQVNSDEAAALGWSADLADLTLWPRPAILAVECEGEPTSAAQ